MLAVSWADEGKGLVDVVVVNELIIGEPRDGA